jgi:tetratricopeptide (TPR) repeat protein
MKKKAIIIACSLLVFITFICLFTVFFQWRFHSSRLREGLMSKAEAYEYFVSNLAEDNAARYYIQAAEALDSSEEVSDIYYSYICWDDHEFTGLEDDPAIAELLELSQPVFDFVRIGVNQDLCTIPKERFRDYSYFLYDLRQVVWLHILRGQLFEKSGEFEKAAETYLDMLQFTHDISTLEGNIHAVVGRNFEGASAHYLSSLVNRFEDEAKCRELLEYMMNLWSDEPSLHDSIDEIFSEIRTSHDKRDARTALYLGSIGFQLSFWGDGDMAELTRRTEGMYTPSGALEYFTDTFDRVGWYAWFQLTKFWRLKEIDRIHDMILQASKDSYRGILSAGIEEKVSGGRITQRWFDPTYRQIQSAARGEVIGRAALIQIALRIHYLTNGEYPDTLEDLTSIIPQEYLVDSFSGQRFIYGRTEDGYLFYSFGQDLEDDDGDPGQSPHEDIVFTFPPFFRSRTSGVHRHHR